MKTTLLFAALAFACIAKSQSVVFQDYFPLKKGTVTLITTRHMKNVDTLRSWDDTVVCKSVRIRSKEVFYFDEHTYDDQKAMPGTSIFCSGVVFYEAGDLWFSPVQFKSELTTRVLPAFAKLFPKEIVFNQDYTRQDGDEVRAYVFPGFETITINSNSFPNCLKLVITQTWPTATYVDTVWFQMGVGVVKWLRSTGRLEEIRQ